MRRTPKTTNSTVENLLHGLKVALQMASLVSKIGGMVGLPGIGGLVGVFGLAASPLKDYLDSSNTNDFDFSRFDEEWGKYNGLLGQIKDSFESLDGFGNSSLNSSDSAVARGNREKIEDGLGQAKQLKVVQEKLLGQLALLQQLEEESRKIGAPNDMDFVILKDFKAKFPKFMKGLPELEKELNRQKNDIDQRINALEKQKEGYEKREGNLYVSKFSEVLGNDTKARYQFEQIFTQDIRSEYTRSGDGGSSSDGTCRLENADSALASFNAKENPSLAQMHTMMYLKSNGFPKNLPRVFVPSRAMLNDYKRVVYDTMLSAYMSQKFPPPDAADVAAAADAADSNHPLRDPSIIRYIENYEAEEFRIQNSTHFCEQVCDYYARNPLIALGLLSASHKEFDTFMKIIKGVPDQKKYDVIREVFNNASKDDIDQQPRRCQMLLDAVRPGKKSDLLHDMEAKGFPPDFVERNRTRFARAVKIISGAAKSASSAISSFSRGDRLRVFPRPPRPRGYWRVSAAFAGAGDQSQSILSSAGSAAEVPPSDLSSSPSGRL